MNFDQDGYTIVPGVVPWTQVQTLRERLITRLTIEPLIHDVALYDEEIRNILMYPILEAQLRSILGAYVIVPYTSATMERYGGFHTDTTGIELAGQRFHKSRQYRMVTIGVYLQGNQQGGGGLVVVPGSHKRPDPYVELMRAKRLLQAKLADSSVTRLAYRLSRGRLYNPARPFEHAPGAQELHTYGGDAILWDPRLVHRGSPRRSGRGEKIAIFYNAGADNYITRQHYMDYVTNVPENTFLRKPRPVPMPIGSTVIL